MNYIWGNRTFSVNASKQLNRVMTDRRKWGTAVATCICSPVHLSRRCQVISSKTLKHLPSIYTSAVTHDFASATVLTDTFAHQHGRRTAQKANFGCVDDHFFPLSFRFQGAGCNDLSLKQLWVGNPRTKNLQAWRPGTHLTAPTPAS